MMRWSYLDALLKFCVFSDWALFTVEVQAVIYCEQRVKHADYWSKHTVQRPVFVNPQTLQEYQEPHVGEFVKTSMYDLTTGSHSYDHAVDNCAKLQGTVWCPESLDEFYGVLERMHLEPHARFFLGITRDSTSKTGWLNECTGKEQIFFNWHSGSDDVDLVHGTEVVVGNATGHWFIESQEQHHGVDVICETNCLSDGNLYDVYGLREFCSSQVDGNYPYYPECEKYVTCNEGTEHLHLCDNDMVWDTATEVCLPRSILPAGHCRDGAVAASMKSGRNTWCQDNNIVTSPLLFANPYSCGGYIQCIFGETLVRNCAHGLKFNPSTYVCDWGHNVDCTDGPTTAPETFSPTTTITEPTTTTSTTTTTTTTTTEPATTTTEATTTTTVEVTTNPPTTTAKPTTVMKTTEIQTTTRKLTTLSETTEVPTTTRQITTVAETSEIPTTTQVTTTPSTVAVTEVDTTIVTTIVEDITDVPETTPKPTTTERPTTRKILTTEEPTTITETTEIDTTPEVTTHEITTVKRTTAPRETTGPVTELIIDPITISDTSKVLFLPAIIPTGFNMMLEHLSTRFKTSRAPVTISNIWDHGCYCGKLHPVEIKDYLGGYRTVDDLDKSCKKYFYNRRCTAIQGRSNGSCANRNLTHEEYRVTFTDTGSLDCKINQADPCLYDLCLLDLTYATEIVDHLSNGAELQEGDTSICAKRNYLPIREDACYSCEGQSPNFKIVVDYGEPSCT